MHRQFDFSAQAAMFAGSTSWEERADALADTLSSARAELSRHLQNIFEAMDDYDSALTEKWVKLLREHAWELANRAGAAHLGLAIVHSWRPRLDVFHEFFPHVEPPPSPLDAARWPAVPRKGVRKGIRAINARTRSCLDEIDELHYWLDEYLEATTEWCGEPEPIDATAAIVETIGGVVARVEDIVELWQDYVVLPHRKLAATQMGRRPPRFLKTEKLIDEMVARFRADHPHSPAA